jgi:hypothetical protein
VVEAFGGRMPVRAKKANAGAKAGVAKAAGVE